MNVALWTRPHPLDIWTLVAAPITLEDALQRVCKRPPTFRERSRALIRLYQARTIALAQGDCAEVEIRPLPCSGTHRPS